MRQVHQIDMAIAPDKAWVTIIMAKAAVMAAPSLRPAAAAIPRFTTQFRQDAA